MREMEMTEQEYCSYKNLSGVDEYSILSAGEDTELKDQETDKEGWYDYEIDEEEIKDIKKQNEEARIRELFQPRDTTIIVKEEKDKDEILHSKDKEENEDKEEEKERLPVPHSIAERNEEEESEKRNEGQAVNRNKS